MAKHKQLFANAFSQKVTGIKYALTPVTHRGKHENNSLSAFLVNYKRMILQVQEIIAYLKQRVII